MMSGNDALVIGLVLGAFAGLVLACFLPWPCPECEKQARRAD